MRTFSDFARSGLGDWAGFVVGWLYWYFWIVVVPVEAIAGAQLLQQWIALPAWLIGVGLMAIMTGVNLLSARSYGEFEFWFALIKVAAIVAFILVAAAWAFGLTSGTGPTWHNLVSGGGFAPRGWLRGARRRNRRLLRDRGRGDHRGRRGGIARAGARGRAHVDRGHDAHHCCSTSARSS